MKILLRKSEKTDDTVGGKGGGIRGRGVENTQLFFIVFDNDFKGTGDGAGGANKLTQCAPAAFVNFNDSNDVILHL
jgi:hypothetical protein